jgi:hypothetical protein
MLCFICRTPIWQSERTGSVLNPPHTIKPLSVFIGIASPFAGFRFWGSQERPCCYWFADKDIPGFAYRTLGFKFAFPVLRFSGFTFSWFQ